jgi:hypothetical protein
MGGVNGATDRVTNANPPPRNPDTVSCKEANKFKQTMDGSTTSNDSSKQSQGTSNSCPIILATRPPLNSAIVAKAAPPYAGETPQPHSTGNQDAPEADAVSQADAAPEGAKKVPADTTQKTDPDTSKKAADDDDTPHRQTNVQALVVGNKSSDGKYFGSLDVSESVVWKNKNFGPEAKLGSRTEVSMLHEPQGSVGVSLQMRNHDDATGGRQPAESTHVQVQGSIGIVNVTRKDDKGRDSVEGELDAVVGVDSYAGKNQGQASLQVTGEYHIKGSDKASVVIQANIPVGDHPQAPSAGIGFKWYF